MRHTTRHLLAPTVGTGVLMAAYLVLRPYGDAGTDAETAEAFAATAWVVSHLLGALALASAGRLALRLADLVDGVTARLARWSGLLGVVLVLPYYGAETFGLHAVGRQALTDPSALALAEEIRSQPLALATFGAGLILLSVAGVAIALTATRALGTPAGWTWPLGLAIALFPAQFALPPAGRIAFSVAYLLVAALFAAATLRLPQAAVDCSESGQELTAQF